MLYEWIIPILAALSVMALGGALLLTRVMRREPLRTRLGTPDRFPGVSPTNALMPGGGGSGAGGDAAMQGGLNDALGAIGSRVSGGKTSESLAQSLVQAGFHDRRAPAVYLGAKAVLMLVGLAGLGLLVLPSGMNPATKFMILLCGTGFLFFAPNLWVEHCRSKRRSEVRSHLPDAIDLLEICASSGMGIDQAWNSVADEVRAVSPVLADEMALTNLEIHLGAARVVAMRNMAKRTGAEELSSLVAVLVQSERFGTSIIDALRTFANSMRETRSMQSQEAAEKMAVKMLFPMILFIFPSVILVMIGPAGMTLFKVFAP
jgi:tight adherence protein C